MVVEALGADGITQAAKLGQEGKQLGENLEDQSTQANHRKVHPQKHRRRRSQREMRKLQKMCMRS